MLRLLDRQAFQATFVEPMRDITDARHDPVVVVWPYVRSIPRVDLGAFSLDAHALSQELVERVYRSGDDRFDHVLLATRTENVFLVVVVNRAERRIHGHRVLDLNREYGLRGAEARR